MVIYIDRMVIYVNRMVIFPPKTDRCNGSCKGFVRRRRGRWIEGRRVS